MTQEEMIQAMAEGDREAFRQFYQETARPVYSFILSLTKSPYEAEDLMQETYLCVWTKAKSYVPLGKPLAWVFTIARNLCYMRFREQKMVSNVAFDELEEKEEGTVNPWNRLRTGRCSLTPLEKSARRSVRSCFSIPRPG